MEIPVDISARTIRKVRNRLVPLLFLLYIVAFLDRINIGFAALTMNADLTITSAQFGLLTGIFFLSYFLFEIPSNLILQRVGARTWIARILVSWGIVAVLTGLVRNAPQLYAARFLLGVAESGFFPGIVLYLTYWFRLAFLRRTCRDGATHLRIARRLCAAQDSHGVLTAFHEFLTGGWELVKL